MRRLAAIVILIFLIIIIAGLFRTAVNPENFRGVWYAADDQCSYLFEDGLIHCGTDLETSRDSHLISGAYTYCKNSVFLFAEGIAGLEAEKEIYLVEKDNGSFLCENRDGSGKIYFIRYHE